MATIGHDKNGFYITDVEDEEKLDKTMDKIEKVLFSIGVCALAWSIGYSCGWGKAKDAFYTIGVVAGKAELASDIVNSIKVVR